MTDLTDKWKKGELPEETKCYVRVNGGIYLGSIRYKNGCHNKKLPCIKSFNGQFITKYIEQVLAPVPSYEEWVGVKKQRDLENKLRHDSDNKNWQLRTENTQLKELLKECELWFTGMVGNMNDKNVGEHNRSLPIGNFEYVFKVFSQKINEVLK